MFSLRKYINEQLNIPREKREITSWQISKLGSCLTGVYLERKGVEPDEGFDDRTLRVFQMGNHVEDWLVELAKKNEAIEIETQGYMRDEKLGVSGMYDLKVTEKATGETMLYEIKSKHSRSFWYMDKQGEGANPQHKMQLWTYLHLTGIPEGRILYVSKDDLAMLEYPVLLNDEQLKNKVMGELDILNRAWKEELPPPVTYNDKDWQAKYCRWHSKCTSQENYLTL